MECQNCYDEEVQEIHTTDSGIEQIIRRRSSKMKFVGSGADYNYYSKYMIKKKEVV